MRYGLRARVGAIALLLVAAKPARAGDETISKTVIVQTTPYAALAHVGVDEGRDLVYVTNNIESHLSIIDGKTDAVLKKLPLATATVPAPSSYGIAVDPARNRIYVATGRGVVRIQGEEANGSRTWTVEGATDLGAGASVQAVVHDPLTDRVYATSMGLDRVVVLEGATGKEVAPRIVVGTDPWGMVLDAGKRRLYVANHASNNVSVVELAQGDATTTLALPGVSNPRWVANNPSTGKVYVSSASGRVAIIDVPTHQVSTLAVGGTGNAIAVNVATNRVYVSNVVTGGSVHPFDGQTNMLLAAHGPLDFPLGIGVNSRTGRIYVANHGQSNKLSVIQGPVPLDTQAPVLPPLADITVEKASPNGTIVEYAYTATDDKDGVLSVTCDPPSGSTFQLGKTRVTCRARDRAGNESTGSFAVVVEDTRAPVFAEPLADLRLEQRSPEGAIAHFEPVAKDAADGAVAVVCEPPSGSTFRRGVTTVRVTAKDTSGNLAETSFKVTVEDTTPPLVMAPGRLAFEATGPEGASVDFIVNAMDLADGPVAVLCMPPSGSTFGVGTTSVVCIATDAAGNQSGAVFEIQVQDTTPPTVVPPRAIEVEQATPEGTRVTFEVTATDIADPAPRVVCTPASGSVFPRGTTRVTCVATDAAGMESAPATFEVTVRDTRAPRLAVPAPLTITAPPGAAVPASDAEVAAWLARATATDAADPAPSVTHDATELAVGATTEVRFTAKDAAGNETTLLSTVTVSTLTVAITAPQRGALSNADVTVAYATTGAPASVSVAATRTVGGAVHDAGPGPLYTLEGEYSVTVTATSPRGSVSDSTRFTIDRTPPSVSIDSPAPGSRARYAIKVDFERWPDATVEDTASCTLPRILYTTGPADGVASTHVRLDGATVPSGVAAITTELFARLGLPMLGRHTLTVDALDAAGNTGTATVAFEVALHANAGTNVLGVKLENGKKRLGVALLLPGRLTPVPLDPTYDDLHVDATTGAPVFTFTAVEPGISSSTPATIPVAYPEYDLWTMAYDTAHLTADGTKKGAALGTRFTLRGRFFGAAGPIFTADAELSDR